MPTSQALIIVPSAAAARRASMSFSITTRVGSSTR